GHRAVGPQRLERAGGLGDAAAERLGPLHVAAEDLTGEVERSGDGVRQAPLVEPGGQPDVAAAAGELADEGDAVERAVVLRRPRVRTLRAREVPLGPVGEVVDPTTRGAAPSDDVPVAAH